MLSKCAVADVSDVIMTQISQTHIMGWSSSYRLQQLVAVSSALVLGVIDVSDVRSGVFLSAALKVTQSSLDLCNEV